MSPRLLFAVLICTPLSTLAQTDPPPTTPPSQEAAAPGVDAAAPAPPSGAAVPAPPVVAGEGDALGRDRDPMSVDAGAGATAGHADPNMVGGSDAAVIQGPPPSTFPPGVMTEEGKPTKISGGVDKSLLDEVEVEFGAFLQVEMALEVEGSQTDVTFLPRELELDVEARFRDTARLRIDLNLFAEWPDATPLAFSSDVTTWDLIDALVEQAFAEWSKWGLTLRAGKMNAPFGSEPLDVIDRVGLSRSTVARKATPDLLTGFYLAYAPLDELDIYAMAVNGWDITIEGVHTPDGNRSKSFGGGFPHRAGKLDSGQWFYQGNLSTLIGVEQQGVNNIRWLLDYSAQLHLTDEVELFVELFYAEEEGTGYNKQKAKDGTEAGQWWGGMITAALHGDTLANEYLQGLRGELRIEYVHDHDLNLRLSDEHEITTLLGFALTLRYQLIRGIDAAVEYSVDFTRGDVKGVSSVANPEDGTIFDGYATHEVLVGLLGYF